MKKVLLSLLLFSMNIIMIDHTQAMDGDKYMNDHDWYQFHQKRVYDKNLSDQSRWEAAQLASDTFSRINPGSFISAHDLYRQGTTQIKYGNSEKGYYYHNYGSNYTDYLNDPQFLPPLSSNQPTVGALWDDLCNPGNYRSSYLSKEEMEYNSRVSPSGNPYSGPFKGVPPRKSLIENLREEELRQAQSRERTYRAEQELRAYKEAEDKKEAQRQEAIAREKSQKEAERYVYGVCSDRYSHSTSLFWVNTPRPGFSAWGEFFCPLCHKFVNPPHPEADFKEALPWLRK